jgi:site-specific DNA recombinase
MNVAGYIRVSTEQQKQEGSHENQRARLEDWADREGHDLTLFEDIAISGQSDERPEYDELMSRAMGGEFDAVAVRELSRFGRSLQQVLQDIERLGENDVEFISVTESFDTSSAMGKAMMQMIGVFNEFWANLARERAQENVERRREEGKPIGRPKKLNAEQLAQVREWHESGIGYSTIAKLCVTEGWVEKIDRSTIRRYCTESSASA